MKRRSALLLSMGVVGLVLLVPTNGRAGATDTMFVVRDAPTAVRFAEAVVEQEYGHSELRKLSPFTATKSGDKWIVVGVRDKHQPKRTRGGIVIVEIAANGGSILSVRYEI